MLQAGGGRLEGAVRGGGSQGWGASVEVPGVGRLRAGAGRPGSRGLRGPEFLLGMLDAIWVWREVTVAQHRGRA